MRFFKILAVAVTSNAATTAAVKYTPASSSITDSLAAGALSSFEDYVKVQGIYNGTCTMANAAVRRDWDSLTATERKKYIAAVQCISTKKSITPRSICPGCRTRYDDFLATHINQTMTIHGTGNFLAWCVLESRETSIADRFRHRYFTWTYEKALREECGYDDYQPYWNWPKYALDPLNSPLFDGSDASMSGNGVYEYHEPVCIPSTSTPYIKVPQGSGGGCVSSGPFSNFTVRLGPVSPAWSNMSTNPRPDGLGYNPRCLRRDINPWISTGWTKDVDVDFLVTGTSDILTFQNRMQGDFAAGYVGVHDAGHMTINGDPGGDLFASPGDPTFYLHHAQIDRTWWTWQNLDTPSRTFVVAGSTSMINASAPDTTLDDMIDLGFNAPAISLRKAMSTLGGAGGPFCYIYG
ncbi:tyrosinase [Phyllosticta capitalensis]